MRWQIICRCAAANNSTKVSIIERSLAAEYGLGGMDRYLQDKSMA